MWSTYQKSNSKNVSCCSFCKKPGHKINKCSDQAVDTLLQEAEEASIVGFILFWEWNPNKSRHPHEFVKFWLQNISDTELKILAYQFKIKPVPAESIELLPLHFYAKWVDQYDENTLNNKFALFSDAQLKNWIDNLCDNFNSNRHSVINRIWDMCHPYRRFRINLNLNLDNEKLCVKDFECPICFSETDLENIIKTGCNHQFCKNCVFQYMRSESYNNHELSCPMCRGTIETLCTPEKKTYELLNTRYCKPAKKPQPVLVSEIIRRQEQTPEPRPRSRKTVLLNWLFYVAWWGFLIKIGLYILKFVANIK